MRHLAEIETFLVDATQSITVSDSVGSEAKLASELFFFSRWFRAIVYLVSGETTTLRCWERWSGTVVGFVSNRNAAE